MSSFASPSQVAAYYADHDCRRAAFDHCVAFDAFIANRCQSTYEKLCAANKELDRVSALVGVYIEDGVFYDRESITDLPQH